MLESVFPEDDAFIGRMRKKAVNPSRGYFLSHFLLPWEISLARYALERTGLSFDEWGGYEKAFKKRLIGFRKNSNRSMFHIKCYSFKPAQFITYHSKGAVLNALFSHGINPEKVGDIFQASDSYLLLLDDELKVPVFPDVQISETKRIPDDLIAKSQKDVDGTVSSLRLDSVLAVAFKPSRNKIQGLIENGGAMINYKYATKPGREVAKGDIISLRGFPRFKIADADDVTKKGRIRIHLEYVD